MSKYAVKFTASVLYYVEADTPDAAEKLATEKLNADESLASAFTENSEIEIDIVR